MSNADTRAALVLALQKLPDLSVTPSQPPTIVAGSAWPAWESTRWVNACLTDSQWFVFVYPPNGDAQSLVDAADQLGDDVATVLWPEGKVTRMEPWAIPVEPGQQAVPVLRFTMEI